MNRATIVDLLKASAGTHGQRAAILAPGREALSFRDLALHVEYVARRLRGAGIGGSDNVAVLLPNGPDLATAFLGVSAAAACAPLNPAFTSAQFEFYLSDLRARALLVGESDHGPGRQAARSLGIPAIEVRFTPRSGAFELLGDAEAAVDWPSPDDTALLLHTSGTTSRPKLVPLSARNLTVSAAHIASTLGLTAADRCLNIMPLFHVHGLVAAVLASLHAGASVVCTNGIYAAGFFDWMREFRPTWYTAVPTMHQTILAQVRTNPALAHDAPFRFIRSSSAPLPVTVLDELERTFRTPVIEAYGMTEAAHQMASNPLPPATRKRGSVGAAAGPEVAIMGADGALLPPGEIGEVVIRGPNVTSGYIGGEVTAAGAFTNGWFRTGDQGRFDDEGYLFLTGRLKELINRGGEKVAPREIDEVLLAHPLIRQAVCFAVPHVQLGEDIGAAVEVRPGAQLTARELRQFASARLPPFKVPRIVRFVDKIPTGATGKLQRTGLAQALGIEIIDDGRRATSVVPPRTRLEARIAAVWRQLLPGTAFGVRDRFEALGGDSLLAATMLTAVGAAEGVDITPSRFLEEGTIEALAADLGAAAPGQRAELVLIQAGATGAPLYWVPGHDGGLVGISRLVHAMQEGAPPVWAVNLRQLPHMASIEALAAYCVALLRARDPGPYRLGGSCFGGVVAYEMARQLTASGAEVEFLTLVDTMHPRWRANAGALGAARALSNQLLLKIRCHAAAVRGLRISAAASYVGLRARAFLRNHTQTAAAQVRLDRSRSVLNRGLALRYTGGPYEGPILVIRIPGKRPDVAALGWRAAVRGSVDVVSLPAYFEGAMSDANLPSLAQALRSRLCPHHMAARRERSSDALVRS